MTTSNKTTITAKYIKEAQYESQLFKVVEYDTKHPILKKFVKVWEDANFIYLKDKHLEKNKDDLITSDYYKIKLTFDEFDNDEGKHIIYIKKIKYKAVKYTEVNDNSDDSDF